MRRPGKAKHRDQTTNTNEASRTAVAVTLQGALMQRMGQGLALRAARAALAGRGARVRFFVTAQFIGSEEASAICAGCWRDAPPGY